MLPSALICRISMPDNKVLLCVQRYVASGNMRQEQRGPVCISEQRGVLTSLELFETIKPSPVWLPPGSTPGTRRGGSGTKKPMLK